jgi:hypothetical protein
MAIQFDNTNTSTATLRPGTATGAIILAGTSNTASSTNSAVVGGTTNTADSNSNSVVVGGQSNQASGSNSAIIGGASNTAGFDSNSVVIGGESNAASGVNSTVLGGTFNTSSNANTAAVGGQSNIANANSSIILGGRVGTTRLIQGNAVFPASASPISFTAGVQQLATLLLGRQTTNATATVLASNASAAGTTNQVILPNNSAYFFQGQVVAGVTGAGDTKGWYVEGVIKRGANAASTALVGTPTVTSSYADAGASAWIITATADTTNGGLAITVTGAAATTIRWVAQIRTTEMTF